MFLAKEYSSEFFQKLLAVPHFSNVTQKSPEAVVQRCSVKNVFLKISKPKVFSCEFCEIFKNTFFHRTTPVAASENRKAEAVVQRCSVKKMS